MINRIASAALIRLASQFPVVGITGPRQSGTSYVSWRDWGEFPA